MKPSRKFILFLFIQFFITPLSGQLIEECSISGKSGYTEDVLEITESALIGDAVIYLNITTSWTYYETVSV